MYLPKLQKRESHQDSGDLRAETSVGEKALSNFVTVKYTSYLIYFMEVKGTIVGIRWWAL